jgi:hypothetical protein
MCQFDGANLVIAVSLHLLESSDLGIGSETALSSDNRAMWTKPAHVERDANRQADTFSPTQSLWRLGHLETRPCTAIPCAG